MADMTSPRHAAVLIEKEMKDSYLSYAMSVIVSRALPDVRDGLKPSQRRVLVAMNDLNLGPRARFKKCAKIAGDTSGNYHPHGEGVVYPTLVRLAQEFNMRVQLVDGQGNFGSVDGDPPAAMRYTEARMAAAAAAMLDDLDKETVDFVPNYDGSREEPTVLPGKFPNLLINGCSGIAVGMATSIPPHNPAEICAALRLLLAKPDAGVDELMQLVPGPDFPTGGILCGQAGVRHAYTTGRGLTTLRCRAECHEEEKGKRARIVITEIPYQVNKATLIESIAQLVKDGRLTSIHDLSDHSDRDGMEIVVELKKGEDPQVTLNQLYKFTQLQVTISIINIALVNNRPRTLSLAELMHSYLDHRREVIRRRSQYLLGVAKARLHIVEGLRIAQAHIDEVIAAIRGAPDAAAASVELQRLFELSERQAEAIVNMRLRALTGLEVEKLEQEWRELVAEIARLEGILADAKQVDALIAQDLDEIVAGTRPSRLTEIGQPVDGLEEEDLVTDDTVAVTISNQGYVKRMDLDNYRSQRRGGSGIRGGDARDGDFIERLFLANNKDSLLFFTSSGKVHQLKVYRLPLLSRTAIGRAAVNLIPGFPPEDSIQAVIPVRDFAEGALIFATADGTVKRTRLEEYARPKAGGIIAIGLAETDRLIDVAVCLDDDHIILGTDQGKSIRFKASDARTMGRPAFGVRGIKLLREDKLCGMAIVRPQASLLTVCRNGYGKRTDYEEYPLQGRGGQGVNNIKTTERNGPVVTLRSVGDDDDVIYITTGGQVVRTPASDISKIGRGTQGVRLITLQEGDAVASAARVTSEDDGPGVKGDVEGGVERVPHGVAGDAVAAEGDEPPDDDAEAPRDDSADDLDDPS
jgi:DNA gyrase subunit A